MEDARVFFRTAVRLPEGAEFRVSMPTPVHGWRTQVCMVDLWKALVHVYICVCLF